MIGGNIEAVYQIKETRKNEIGEMIESWIDAGRLKGYLDLSSGTSRYEDYNAKIQDSDYTFICDYSKIDKSIQSRLIIDGISYDILLIGNPMNLNRQLEFYLKSVR